MNDCFLLFIGSAPTELAATQNGLNSVSVSWTAPSAPPSGGYHITANPGNVNVVAPSSPHTITIQQLGVFNIQVRSTSQHLPGKMVELDGVAVRGEGNISSGHNFTVHYLIARFAMNE